MTRSKLFLGISGVVVIAASVALVYTLTRSHDHFHNPTLVPMQPRQAVSLARDGRLLYREGDTLKATISTKETTLAKINPDTTSVFWAPSGNQAVTISSAGEENVATLYSFSSSKSVTLRPGISDVVWSPNEDQLAYITPQTDNYRLRIASLSSLPVDKDMGEMPAPGALAWSPKGIVLIGSTYNLSETPIYLYSNSAWTKIGQNGLLGGKLSPSGDKLLVATVDDSFLPHLATLSLPGGKLTNLKASTTPDKADWITNDLVVAAIPSEITKNYLRERPLTIDSFYLLKKNGQRTSLNTPNPGNIESLIYSQTTNTVLYWLTPYDQN